MRLGSAANLDDGRYLDSQQRLTIEVRQPFELILLATEV